MNSVIWLNFIMLTLNHYISRGEKSKLRIAHLIWFLCLHVHDNIWPNYNVWTGSHIWLNSIDTAQRLKDCLHVSEQLSKVYQSHAMVFFIVNNCQKFIKVMLWILFFPFFCIRNVTLSSRGWGNSSMCLSSLLNCSKHINETSPFCLTPTFFETNWFCFWSKQEKKTSR